MKIVVEKNCAETKCLIDSVTLSLLLWDVNSRNLYMTLAADAKEILMLTPQNKKEKESIDDLKVAALDFWNRAGIEFVEANNVKKEILNLILTFEDVATFALETLIYLYGLNNVLIDLKNQKISEDIKIEIEAYKFILGVISKEELIGEIKKAKEKTLSRIWRFTCILDCSPRGRKLLKNDSFFLSDKWRDLLAVHGFRGRFYGVGKYSAIKKNRI